MIGQVVDGKYLIKNLLGQGGMGSVYEAEHTTTGRRCAVKVIINEQFVQDPKVVGRFQREARAAGAVDTQYIAQVLDAGIDRDTGLPFLAMEFLDGEDLMHLIKRVGPLPPDTALRIVAQACLGLQKAHAQGVVHRDIKPHNLFLTKRDAGEVIVKILDFGIAKVKMDQSNTTDGADLTRTGNLLGSPLYVSPEQARGQREIDHRTDIWSLGAVLYQMLAGRTPYQHATALGELILLICTEPPPPVQEFAPWVTPEVAKIVHGCLKQSASERFQTAEDLFEAVRPLLPGGWTLNDEMLLSLSDSQKLESAPRLPHSLPPPPPVMTTSGSITASRGLTGTSIVAAAVASADEAAMTTGGAGALAQTQVRPAKTSRAPVALGAAALLVAGAVGIWVATRPAGGAAAAGSDTTAPASSPPTPPPPEPSTAATTAPAPPPPPPETLRYKILVRPKDAKVVVDGEPVEVVEGEIVDDWGEFSVESKPGAELQVHAERGGGKADGSIFILNNGPNPPFIEVKDGQVTSIKRVPTAGSSAPTAVQPPPVATPTIIRDKGEFGK